MANQMNQSAQAAQHAQFFSARGPNILLLAPQPGGGGGVFKGAASATGHLTPAAQAALEDAWEAQAFAEDLQASSGAAHQWPPRSYACTFCAREFRTAQALGGHMNVHRRERAQANQLAMLRQAATFTQLAAIGPPVQASPEQLQAGGPLACVITRFQEAKAALLPHVDASHHPEMGRATLKLAAAPSAALGNDSGFPTLQPAPDAGATSEYLDGASSPAQSASNSPLSSPRPSQCSSTSTDKKKSRKRSHQAAAEAYGDILTAKPNSVAASFTQILQPNKADGPATAHARGLVLPLRAFQPYNHSSVAEDPSACGVKRMREWARGSSSPDKYCGDTECEDTGLDLELRL